MKTLLCFLVRQRWAESEKLTPDPAPKLVSLPILDSESGFVVPISAMLLHTFYIIHIESGSCFSQKFKS